MRRKTTHGEWLHYDYAKCRCDLCRWARKDYDAKGKLFRRCFQLIEKVQFEMEQFIIWQNRSIEEIEASIDTEIEDYIMRRIPTTCRNCNRKFNKLLRGGKCSECVARSSFSWYKKPQYDKSNGIWYKPTSQEYIRIRTRLPAYWTRDGKLVFCEGSMRYYCDPATYEVRQWSTDHAMNEELKEIEKDVEHSKMEEREV